MALRISRHRLACRIGAGNNEGHPTPPSGRGTRQFQDLRAHDSKTSRGLQGRGERLMPLQSEGRSPAHLSLHVKCRCGRDLRAQTGAGGCGDHLLVVPRRRSPCPSPWRPGTGWPGSSG